MPQKNSWESRKQVWRPTTGYFLFLLSRENIFPEDPERPCDRSCNTFQWEMALLYGESNAGSFSGWRWTPCFPRMCWCSPGPKAVQPRMLSKLAFLLENGLAVSSGQWCYRGGAPAWLDSLSPFQIRFTLWLSLFTAVKITVSIISSLEVVASEAHGCTSVLLATRMAGGIVEWCGFEGTLKII